MPLSLRERDSASHFALLVIMSFPLAFSCSFVQSLYYPSSRDANLFLRVVGFKSPAYPSRCLKHVLFDGKNLSWNDAWSSIIVEKVEYAVLLNQRWIAASCRVWRGWYCWQMCKYVRIWLGTQVSKMLIKVKRSKFVRFWSDHWGCQGWALQATCHDVSVG